MKFECSSSNLSIFLRQEIQYSKQKECDGNLCDGKIAVGGCIGSTVGVVRTALVVVVS